MPQKDPLQPVPDSEQLSVELGLEPATGVIVATMTAVVEVATVPGAASCRMKWLVMEMLTLACFEGSAALCAVNVTVRSRQNLWSGVVAAGVDTAAERRAGGAEENPADRAVRLPALLTVSEKFCLAPGSTLVAGEDKATEISLMIVTCALPCADCDAVLAAVT